jgi:hypothetical protein
MSKSRKALYAIQIHALPFICESGSPELPLASTQKRKTERSAAAKEYASPSAQCRCALVAIR